VHRNCCRCLVRRVAQLRQAEGPDHPYHYEDRDAGQSAAVPATVATAESAHVRALDERLVDEWLGELGQIRHRSSPWYRGCRWRGW
jgi:hypothetical protein